MAEAGVSSADLATGIGRPVDPEWAKSFFEVVSEVVPESMGFERRVIPGIIYVAGGELTWKGAGTFAEGDQDHKQQLVADYVGTLVTSMCERGLLDAKSATSGVSLPVLGKKSGKPLDFYRHTPTGRLGFHAKDLKRPGDNEGYQISSERDAFVTELGLPQKAHGSSSRKYPKHSVILGAYNKDFAFDALALKRIKKALPSRIVYGPISVVRTDTKPLPLAA